MQGYRNNSPENAAVFEFGRFHSGDRGYIDDEVVVGFTDRAKDIIKTGGENVSSVEVERVVLTHSDVEECAVAGLPHDPLGRSRDRGHRRRAPARTSPELIS